MKKDIHPEYHPEARVVCGCGNTFVTGATKPMIKTDICSACHPFFTGEQRIVDTAGQVERYMRRLEKREEMEQVVAPESEPPEEKEDATGGKRGAKATAGGRSKSKKKAKE
jgi:large subunit ribosomal protein L31